MLITDIFFGMAIGALTGMGVGGGGLLVIYLTMFAKMPQKDAQGINLLFFVFAAGAALSVHLKKRRIDRFLVAVLALSGMAASIPGAYLASHLPSEVTKKIFGAMLFLSGAVTLYRAVAQRKKSSDKD